MSTWIPIGPADQVPPGESRCFLVRDRRIAVFNHKGGFLAFDDLCPHAEAPLSDGWIEDNAVVCPWHGARFQCADGAVTRGPAKEGVTTYSIESREDGLHLHWPHPPSSEPQDPQKA